MATIPTFTGMYYIELTVFKFDQNKKKKNSCKILSPPFLILNLNITPHVKKNEQHAEKNPMPLNPISKIVIALPEAAQMFRTAVKIIFLKPFFVSLFIITRGVYLPFKTFKRATSVT